MPDFRHPYEDTQKKALLLGTLGNELKTYEQGDRSSGQRFRYRLLLDDLGYSGSSDSQSKVKISPLSAAGLKGIPIACQ
jgi:hypothetical protein